MKIVEILNKLNTTYKVYYSSLDEEKTIKDVSLYNNRNTDYDDEIIYVTSRAENQFKYNSCVIVLMDAVGVKDIPKNVIYIEADIDEDTMILELKLIIEDNLQLKSIYAELYSCITLDNYLEPLLDKAFQYLKNPIICYDHLHNVRSYRIGDNVENHLWMEDIELGHLNFSNLNEMSYLCIEHLISTGELEFKILDHRCKSLSVKSGGRLVGFIALLEYHHNFSERDEKILQILSDIISVKTYDVKISSLEYLSSNNNNLLRDLLSQNFKSHDALKHFMKLRSWKKKKYHRMYVFQDRENHTFNYFNHVTQRLINTNQHMKYIYHEGRIVLLEEFDTSADTKIERLILKNFSHSTLEVGVSEVFEDLLKITIYYNQAVKALMHSNVENNYRSVKYYKDYMFNDFLRQCCSHMDVRSYYHPHVVFIGNYDNQFNTEFGRTLFYYLEEQRSLMRCSKRMNVHKNTVTYRIEKIKDILGYKLDNMSVNFHILLTFKMMEMEKTIGK